MKTTLFVSDLDGTLLGSDAKLSENTSNILNRLLDKGLIFTYATARSFVSAKEVTKSLCLKTPVITYNGAFIVDPIDGSVMDACIMERQLIEWIFEAVSDRRLYPLVYAMVDNIERVSWITGHENKGIINYLNSRKGDERLRPVSSYAELFAGEVFYITFIGTLGDMEPIYNLLKPESYINCVMQEDVYVKDEIWVEMYRHDAKKDIAARKLKDLLKAERIVCFGDNLNDLPMFMSSDEKYAVKNANAEVKAMATAIIDSNDDDGVARWIDGYMSSLK